MNGSKLKKWRLRKGWTLKTGAKQLGVSTSKLRQMEEADKPSPQDDRLSNILVAGKAAIDMYNGVLERHRIIEEQINLEK